MGAFHAGNFFFRRPDIFDSVIALSGLYTAGYGFPMYSDELTFMNSPIDFLREMPADHPWMDLYKKRKIYICVGQGKWEDELLESTRALDTVLCQRGIPANMDYWGFDVDHDWCWWRVQLPYFMEKIVPKK
jgi:esterase/lipase superfamily enzyme